MKKLRSEKLRADFSFPKYRQLRFSASGQLSPLCKCTQSVFVGIRFSVWLQLLRMWECGNHLLYAAAVLELFVHSNLACAVAAFKKFGKQLPVTVTGA